MFDEGRDIWDEDPYKVTDLKEERNTGATLEHQVDISNGGGPSSSTMGDFTPTGAAPAAPAANPGMAGMGLPANGGGAEVKTPWWKKVGSTVTPGGIFAPFQAAATYVGQQSAAKKGAALSQQQQIANQAKLEAARHAQRMQAIQAGRLQAQPSAFSQYGVLIIVGAVVGIGAYVMWNKRRRR